MNYWGHGSSNDVMGMESEREEEKTRGAQCIRINMIIYDKVRLL